MPRVMVFLMTLMFVLPSDGSAQTVPSPGDRIRIKQVDGTVLTGTLATLSAETIQLSVGSAERMTEIPVAGIEVLETSLGQRTNYPKYIGRTAFVTSIMGAAIAGLTWEPCTWFCISPFATATRRGAVGAGLGLAGEPDSTWVPDTEQPTKPRVVEEAWEYRHGPFAGINLHFEDKKLVRWEVIKPVPVALADPIGPTFTEQLRDFQIVEDIRHHKKGHKHHHGH